MSFDDNFIKKKKNRLDQSHWEEGRLLLIHDISGITQKKHVYCKFNNE